MPRGRIWSAVGPSGAMAMVVLDWHVVRPAGCAMSAQLLGPGANITVADQATLTVTPPGVGPNNWTLTVPGVRSLNIAVTVQPNPQLPPGAVASNANGKLELFGTNASGQFVHSQQGTIGGADFPAFTAENDPAPPRIQVAVEAIQSGRLEAIRVDTAGNLSHRAQNVPGATSWSGWQPLTNPV